MNQAVFTCEKITLLWKLVGRWWGINLDSKDTLEGITDAGCQRGYDFKGLRRWMAMV